MSAQTTAPVSPSVPSPTVASLAVVPDRARPARPRLRPAGRRADGPTWNWRIAARCRTDDSEELFVTGARQRDARELCFACPVRTECLAHALDQQIEFGVWGGMTERERRALLRRRPGVRDWAALLGRARTDHYSAAADRPAVGM